LNATEDKTPSRSNSSMAGGPPDADTTTDDFTPAQRARVIADIRAYRALSCDFSRVIHAVVEADPMQCDRLLDELIRNFDEYKSSAKFDLGMHCISLPPVVGLLG
jgi:hypothetical protein